MPQQTAWGIMPSHRKKRCAHSSLPSSVFQFCVSRSAAAAACRTANGLGRHPPATERSAALIRVFRLSSSSLSSHPIIRLDFASGLSDVRGLEERGDDHHAAGTGGDDGGEIGRLDAADAEGGDAAADVLRWRRRPAGRWPAGPVWWEWRTTGRSRCNRRPRPARRRPGRANGSSGRRRRRDPTTQPGRGERAVVLAEVDAIGAGGRGNAGSR